MPIFFRTRYSLAWLAVAGAFFCSSSGDLIAQSDWKKEWERTLQEAKKEGTIVVGIQARAELKKEFASVFKTQCVIDMELHTARGPQNASLIASEFKGGV